MDKSPTSNEDHFLLEARTLTDQLRPGEGALDGQFDHDYRFQELVKALKRARGLEVD